MPRRSLLFLVVLACAGAVLFYSASDSMSLGWLKGHRDELVAFCQRSMLAAMLIYCGAYVLLGALCLPGGGLFALAGGMLFGHVLGTSLATLSAVGGATVAFLAARYWLHDWVHARFARAFRVIDRGVERDGVLYLFMLRLIIVVPFFVVNPVMGLTDMRLKTFVWASTLGMLANAFMWVNAGTMLNHIERIEDVLSGPVVLSFTLIGVLPLMLKWLFIRKK